MTLELIAATGNPHKIEEFRQLLEDLEGSTVSVPGNIGKLPSVEETAPDFRGNALLKAEAARNSAGKAGVLSDDSGLAVEALNGEPGVYSSRYAGRTATDEENMEKLLKKLEGVEKSQRRAAFVCMLCLLLPGRDIPHFFEGRVEGTIAETPRGNLGFGYDPVFIPEGHERTFAELGPVVKNRLSHRARALAQLKDFLRLQAGEP